MRQSAAEILSQFRAVPRQRGTTKVGFGSPTAAGAKRHARRPSATGMVLDPPSPTLPGVGSHSSSSASHTRALARLSHGDASGDAAAAKRTQSRRASTGSRRRSSTRPLFVMSARLGPERLLPQDDISAASIAASVMAGNPEDSEDKEGVIGCWLDSYSRARPQFASLAVECEVLLQQARHATFTHAYRGELVTAAAFDVLDKTLPQLGVYSHVLRVVRDVLAASVYIGACVHLACTSVRVPGCSLVVPLTYACGNAATLCRCRGRA